MMLPRNRATAPLERYEQTMLAAWLNAKRLVWLHPANESKRSVVMGAMLKRQGLSPGAPDVLIFQAPPGAPGVAGVAIELKRRNATKSAVTEQQTAWLKRLEACGWRTKVCFGADDAIDFLTGLGYE